MDEQGKDLIKQFKKERKDLLELNYEECIWAEVYGTEESTSSWILLPNNTFLLVEYRGVETGGGFKFMDFESSLFSDKTNGTNKPAMILFNSEGKVIGNFRKEASN